MVMIDIEYNNSLAKIDDDLEVIDNIGSKSDMNNIDIELIQYIEVELYGEDQTLTMEYTITRKYFEGANINDVDNSQYQTKFLKDGEMYIDTEAEILNNLFTSNFVEIECDNNIDQAIYDMDFDNIYKTWVKYTDNDYCTSKYEIDMTLMYNRIRIYID